MQVEYDMYDEYYTEEDFKNEVRQSIVNEVTSRILQNMGGWNSTVEEAAKSIKQSVANQITSTLSEQLNTTGMQDRIVNKAVEKLHKQSIQEVSNLVTKQSMNQVSQAIKDVAKQEADKIRDAMLGTLK